MVISLGKICGKIRINNDKNMRTDLFLYGRVLNREKSVRHDIIDTEYYCYGEEINGDYI